MVIRARGAKAAVAIFVSLLPDWVGCAASCLGCLKAVDRTSGSRWMVSYLCWMRRQVPVQYEKKVWVLFGTSFCLGAALFQGRLTLLLSLPYFHATSHCSSLSLTPPISTPLNMFPSLLYFHATSPCSSFPPIFTPLHIVPPSPPLFPLHLTCSPLSSISTPLRLVPLSSLFPRHFALFLFLSYFHFTLFLSLLYFHATSHCSSFSLCPPYFHATSHCYSFSFSLFLSLCPPYFHATSHCSSFSLSPPYFHAT